MKPPKQPKEFVFKRRAPDLPDEQLAPPDAAALASHDIALAGCSLDGTQMEGRNAGTLRIQSSTIQRVCFAGSKFASIVWKDVRLTGCDLANLETRSLSLVRVEFLNCRMTGMRALEGDCQDVLISEGDQRYSQFRFAKFRAAEFDRCNFGDADFCGSDLSGSIFRRCNLQNAEMSRVKLRHADLRGSNVEDLHLNAEDIRGAVVDPSQAMIFASLLGIRIG